MIWHDLLFAHWPIAPDLLRAQLPAGLELDTFNGRAWLGIVPFRMSGIRPRCLPPVPGLSAFPELNLRTYVTAGGKPGVWFFTLDATSRLAVRTARRFYHLPYCNAQILCRCAADGWINYRSYRVDPLYPPAEFAARYRSLGSSAAIAQDPLASWLTARYCLYAADPGGGLWRGEIDHAPWPLESAEAVIETNTLATATSIELPASEPLLHFSRWLDVVAWTLDRIR
jgi:uncharacterized protein YqjF (DUF2071 family)